MALLPGSEGERELGWFRLSPPPSPSLSLRCQKVGRRVSFSFPGVLLLLLPRFSLRTAAIAKSGGVEEKEEKIKQESHPRLCEEEEIL